METKKRVFIVKNITLIAFILNCASVIFTIWVDTNYITRFIASVIWFITQCWLMLFIYANFIYVPKDKIRLKKEKHKPRLLVKTNNKKINLNFIKTIDFVISIILSLIFLICSYRFIIGIDMGHMALFDLCAIFISYFGIADIAIKHILERD